MAVPYLASNFKWDEEYTFSIHYNFNFILPAE